MTNTGGHRHGLTLGEAVILVAIVALLTGILCSIFAQARQSAGRDLSIERVPHCPGFHGAHPGPRRGAYHFVP